MKKLAGFLTVLIFTLNIFFSPVTIFAQNPAPAPAVDVYAAFWPIVPGTTVADSMFWAKQLKESLGGIFSFGNISKSERQIGIAEKRLVEAYKLLENKDYSNMLKSLELNKAARDEALKLKKAAVDQKQDVKELTNRLVPSLEKQQQALIFIESKVSEDQKGKITEIVNQLTLQISEAK